MYFVSLAKVMRDFLIDKAICNYEATPIAIMRALLIYSLVGGGIVVVGL